MQGTPFIHQGDEIGMTNVNWTDLNKYKDVEIKNTYQSEVLKNKTLTYDQFIEGTLENSRDHARTPYQWDDSKYAGFSNYQPWIDVNDNYKEINAKNELNNPNGIYHYLKKLIKFREESDYSQLIIDAEFELLDPNNTKLFAYSRIGQNRSIKIIANWSDEQVNISHLINQNNKIILNTEIDFDQNTLKPWQTIIVE
ncbi:hypothetical protein [Mycoplasma capricolum]|nr:hypothetical protein [Mycoplasma capricolum]